MSKYIKILIGLGVIGLLIICCFALYHKYNAGWCDLYIGDDKCTGNELGYKPFRQEDWAYKDDSSYEAFIHTNCMREAMICDLTQNVIPIGTPYEKVVALFGAAGENIMRGKESLEYTSGGNVSGLNSLVITFKDGKIKGFHRNESR